MGNGHNLKLLIIQFRMLPSRAVNNSYIILNVDYIHRLHYIWFQNNPGQVNI